MIGDTCGPDEFCDFEGDGCDYADATGICQPRPAEFCAEIYAPVCGCDGMTYGNLCEAQRGGVDAARIGTCEDPNDLCALPPESGDCDGAFPRWYFNDDSGQCEEFVYGGCGGNGNNFETREACEARCDDTSRAMCVDQSRDPIVLGGSRSFGECLEGCVSRLSLGIPADGAMCDRVTLEVCDNNFDGFCSVHEGTLSPEAHAAARGVAQMLAGVALDERYGCPDCADGGASAVILLRAGARSEHTYETGNPPAVLAEADALVSGLIDALRRCEATALVSPDPGCVAR
ncbi:MAG: hypothetical protein H6705_15865 [Myxococcales bacterium]|nr:hypothetical protein [Myxococcales bacterium]